MGNAGSASMQRERHKSSDLSTPNSPPYREFSGRDSVASNVGANSGSGTLHSGSSHQVVGVGIAAATVGAPGGGAVIGGGGVGGQPQAFTFDNNKPVSVLHVASSIDDEEQPYYTKPVVGAGDSGVPSPTKTATRTRTTTTTTSTPITETTASAENSNADPEFSQTVEPRKRSNTVPEGAYHNEPSSAAAAAPAPAPAPALTGSSTGGSVMSAADEESAQQAAASAMRSAEGVDDEAQFSSANTALPTVLRWDGGGKNVTISGTFSKWKPIPMVRSHGNFVTIIDLPEGDHQYKFCVDGEWKYDPKLKSIENDVGDKNNLVSVRQSDFEVFQALAKDSENAPNYAEREYSQDVPQAKPWEKVSGPPVLPPHLLQVILNKDTPLSCEPTLLPEPNHVMLNHLYALSIKDGVMVLSATHRYRKKYVTTLLYKPI